MSSYRLTLVCLLLAAPALATGLGPPVEVPVVPEVPVGPVTIEAPPSLRPPLGAPPFEITLPGRPELPGTLPPGGPPDPLPPASAPQGPPDLVGQVILPGVAGHVFDLAPPFGADLPASRPSSPASVPEPTAAALLGAGLLGMALRRRASRRG